MKKLIIIAVLVSLNYGNNLSSVITNPFNLDFTKKITLSTLLNEKGIPEHEDSVSSIDDNIKIRYPKFNCYLALDNKGKTFIYTIEIKKGTIDKIEIGMSKRKFLHIYGEPVEKETLKNREIFHYYYSKNSVNYLLSLEFKGKKLSSLFINRSI